ncbi:MAG: endonuclease [Thermoanaerobaculia bacterium]|nr:endonuclease [Thermoanaerobaculia bacterium]
MSALPLRSLALLALVLVCPAAAPGQVINEFVANHTGTDTYAFVELRGTPDTDYSGLAILELEGDGSSNPGTVDFAFPVGTTNATGHWASGFPPPRDIENTSITLLLVEGFSGSVGQDLDTNNDGVLDATPWTALLDAVAVDNEAVDDHVYAAAALTANYDGVSFLPGGASRIPDGTDTDTVADWTRNDFDGAGLPGFTGTLVPGEATNTPGAANSTEPPPPPGAKLNEFVLDLDGADAQEYVEIWGTPTTSYAASHVLIVDSDGSGDPGVIEAALAAGTTSGAGLWHSGFLPPGSLGDTARTLLLVTEFTGAVGQDLDTDDDGAFDATPWTSISDAVAVTDGAGVDVPYAAVVLAPGFDGLPDKVGGASRFPNGVDTDAAGDWRRNDFERAGLPGGGAATQSSPEAANTPGMPNTVLPVDYYRGVAATDAATLRATLHLAIDDHVKVPYTSAETDTWDVLNLADQDPVDTTSILDVYKNAVYTKIAGGTGVYNREHSWPNSYGFPSDGAGNYPYTDCHHLFASDTSYNSDRGNLPFGSCPAGCTERATLANHGVGGGSGVYPGNSNWFSASAWETWSARRGDVARAQLYMDLRYEGGAHGATGAAEPDLRLTDDTGLIVGTGGNATVAYMGRLAAILAWHLADPVDARERRRNEIVHTYQANRNPFVDHPVWVRCLWLGDCVSLWSDGFESGVLPPWSATP